MLKIVIIMIIMYFLHALSHQWFNFISKGMYSVCTIYNDKYCDHNYFDVSMSHDAYYEADDHDDQCNSH